MQEIRIAAMAGLMLRVFIFSASSRQRWEVGNCRFRRRRKK
jgi:hypothetical protein